MDGRINNFTHKLIALFLIELFLLWPAITSAALVMSEPVITRSNGEVRVYFETDASSSYNFSYYRFDETIADAETLESQSQARNHTIRLTDLYPGIRYYFTINTAATTGSDSKFGSFTTPDDSPPVQGETPSLVNATDDMVKFEWTRLDLQDFSRYLIYRNGVNVYNTTRTYYIDNAVSAKTTYIYQLAYLDSSGNIGPQSLPLVVLTPDADSTAPTISNIRIVGLSNTSVMVLWQTNEPASTIVHYGPSRLDSVQSVSGYILNHTVSLLSLQPGTSYKLIVSSCDRKSNCKNSSEESYIFGRDYSMPVLNFTLPSLHNTNSLNIRGRTKPLAMIYTFVNDFDAAVRANQADVDGWVYLDIPLDTNRNESRIRLEAIDYMGNSNIRDYTVKIDAKKPVVSLVDIPLLSTAASIKISGNISEEVTLDIYVTQTNDAAKEPSPPETLNLTRITSSTAVLDWDESNSTDRVSYYKIYRDDVLVGTSKTTSFADCISSDSGYNYYVTTVTEFCVESQLSDSLSVTSPVGSSCTSNVNLKKDDCTLVKPQKTVKVNAGKFQQSATLKQGNNNVRLLFYDKANNTVVWENTVIYDVKAPSIVWTNLNDISPAYDSVVTIRGRVDENATVIITINNESTYTGRTDAQGNFSIDVELEKVDFDEYLVEQRARNQLTGRSVTGLAVEDGDLNYLAESDTNNYYSYMDGDFMYNTTKLTLAADSAKWKNRVDITAIDDVGRMGSLENKRILYTLCSFDNHWMITLSEVEPGMLIPRHMLNGISQITMNFKIEWVAGSGYLESEKIPHPSTSIKFRQIAREDKDKWDNDWFTSPRIIMKPNTNNTQGFVIIEAKRQNTYFGDDAKYRKDLAKAIRNGSTAINNFNTTFEMEDNISGHRRGECLVNGFGCVRLPLQIEINYQDPVFLSGQNNLMNVPNIPYRSTNLVQRQCWDVEVAIDKRIDPGIIPKSFLRGAVNFLNQSITVIDKILKPLNKVKEYVLYACLGSWVILYIKAVQKSWSCQYSGTIKSLTGSGFKAEIAQQGLCVAAYGNKQATSAANACDEGSCTACMECTQAVKSYNDFVQTMQFICDRLMCPSAPSFMKYAKDQDKKQGTRRPVTLHNVSTGSGSLGSFQFNLRMQSDCKGMPYTFEEIATQYKRWLDYKDGNPFKFYNPKMINGPAEFQQQLSQQITCQDPHMPNVDCCVFEYMSKYDSVCGLPKGTLFDEMKESYCAAGTGVALRNSSTNMDINAGGVNYNEECDGMIRRTWNSLAGICEKNAGQDVKLIDAKVSYGINVYDQFYEPNSLSDDARTARAADENGRLDIVQVDDKVDTRRSTMVIDGRYNMDGMGQCPPSIMPTDNANIFYLVEPTEGSAPRNSAEGPRYTITRGYISRTIDLDRANSAVAGREPGSMYPVGSSSAFLPLNTIPEEWFLADPNTKVASQTYLDKNIANKEGFNSFKREMSMCANTYGEKSTKGSEEVVKVLKNNEGKSKADIMQQYDDRKNKNFDEVRKNVNDRQTFEKILDDNKGAIFTNDKVNKIDSGNTQLYSGIKNTYETENQKMIADSKVLAVYTQIRSAMDIYDKPEIVDPSSSFLRSIQCICLPAITGYLKLYRSIMVAVKACLTTILLTGDGNPGICQAVLTQYICDIIYDLIRCFTTKYAAGVNSRIEDDSLPGNALGTLVSAGRDVERTIAGRYGNSAFYKSLFGEKQLVHAICLWFFTGAFKFDFQALTEGSSGDVPVDSQVLIYPCQRRYVGYNSANLGRVTWNYYFGIGIVAGARIRYQTYLMCSQGFTCDYGFGPEECDCNKLSSTKMQAVSIPGAPTSLDRYDVLEDKFDGVREDTVRYDKVIVVYDYVDKDNQRVSHNATCNIRTVGGEPPGFCQFDVGNGMYRCGISIGQEEYAVLSPISRQPEMRVGEQLMVIAEVTQKLPIGLECDSIQSCKSVKYLALEVTDSNGGLLLNPNSTGNYMPILMEGKFAYRLPPQYITVSDQFLASAVPSGGIQSTSLTCLTYMQKYAGRTPANRIISECQGQFDDAQQSIALYIDTDRTVKVKDPVEPAGTPSKLSLRGGGACKFPAGQHTIVCIYDLPSQRKITLVLQDQTGSGITLTDLPTGPTSPEDRVRSSAGWDLHPGVVLGQTASTPCQGRTEVLLKGKVMIYDSELDAGTDLYVPSKQIYSYNGAEQVQTFDLRVICEDASTQNQNINQLTTTFEQVVPSVSVGLSKISTAGSVPRLTGLVGRQDITILATKELISASYQLVDDKTKRILVSSGIMEKGNSAGATTEYKTTSNSKYEFRSGNTYSLTIFVRPAYFGGQSLFQSFKFEVG